MNIFGFNIHISRVPVHPSRLTSHEKALALTPPEWLRGADLDLRPSTLSSAYEQSVWVYRAINLLAEQVANIPFLFSAGERGRENLVTSGPLLDFYARPHPQVNRFQYWELRVIWLMLRGECIRIPILEEQSSSSSSSSVSRFNPSTLQRSNAPRRLARVLILDPARFQHIVEDGHLIGWRYTGLGPQAPLSSQVFLPEEVWFEKLPNPFDFWRGLSPLAVAAVAARTDFAASAFMQGIIENNADTGVIVRSDKPLGDDQQEQILTALRERKRRAGQADRPVFLNAVTEIVKPQLSSSDLQFLENRKFSRAEICAAFGVPEEIVTTSDYNKYDVMAGARLNFIENRVAPLCARLEAEENNTTIPVLRSLGEGGPALLHSSSLAAPERSGGGSSSSIENQNSKIENVVGWFDLDSLPIMQEARRNRLAAAKTGFDMGVPFNELNRVLDLGFKPLPWGDRGYLATKLQEVGNDSPRSKVQSPKSEARVDSGELIVDSGNPLARAEQLFGTLQNYPLSTNHYPLLAPLLRKLRRFLFEQRQRALAALLPALSHISPTSPTRLTGPTGPTNPLATIPSLLDLAAETAQLAASLKPILADLAPAPLEEFNQATLATMQQALQEGLAKDEAPEQLASRLRAVFNEATARRAPEFAQAALAGSAGISAGELQSLPAPGELPQPAGKEASAPAEPNP